MRRPLGYANPSERARLVERVAAGIPQARSLPRCLACGGPMPCDCEDEDVLYRDGVPYFVRGWSGRETDL